MAQTLVKGGYLLDTERPLERGDLLVEDGRIQQVGGEVQAPEAQVIDARGKIVMPGLVNAHTHSSQAIEKGLCDRLPLDSWMMLASYGGGDRPLSPRELYVSAMVGAVEMLQTGTTSVLDAPFPPPACFDEGMDAIMQAYADIGMRATVAAHYADLDFLSSVPLGLLENEEVAARPPRITVARAMEQAESFVGRWRNRSPRLQPMLAPSSLPRCSIELFEASADLARRLDVRLQTHLLSAKSQVPVGQKRYAGSTVKFLEGIGCLAPWASFAHAIWVDEEEIELMAGTGCVVVHNPVSNLKLGAGIAPVPAMLRAGVNVALGTDGGSSNDSQNMFETLKAAAVLHRIAGPPETWPGAEDSLRMCWLGGAKAIGQPVGRLEPGHRADLTLLNTRELFVAPKEQLLQQIVYSEMGSSVDTVLVDGNVVVREGRVVTVDTDALHQEAQELVSRIWSDLPKRLARFEEVRPMLERLERAVGALPLRFARTCGW